MDNPLYITLFDTFFNGYSIESLDIFTVTTLIFGVAVIVNKNPIGALLCLIGLFGTVALYLILCGLSFIGFSYLIVYIGAVSILFLFILMLINIRTSELQSNNSNSVPLALFITIILNYILFQVLPYQIAIINSYGKKLSNLIYSGFENKYNDSMNFANKILVDSNPANNTNIMFISSNNWDGNIAETSHISAIGNILYTAYNMWLFLASLILLLAMVGAIVITIKQEKAKGISSMVERLFYTQKVKGSNPLFLRIL